MRKTLLLFLFVFLVACGAPDATQNTPDSDVVEEEAATIAPGETTAVSEAPSPTTAAADTPTGEAEPTTAETQGVASFSPATTVAEAAEIRAQDWVQGAEDGSITIIEYGDFQ